MSSKGGGSSGGTSTVTQTNLPEYARPYFERLMSEGEALTNEPYQAYQGPRLAGFTPDMLNAQQGVRDLVDYGTPNIDAATGMVNSSVAGATGNYDPHTYDYLSANPNARVGYDDYQNLFNTFYNSNTQNVLDVQKQQALLDFQRQGIDRNSAAVRAGAFGGSRQAVGNYLAEEGMLNRQNDIEAQGLYNAWNSATSNAIDAQKYNIDQNLRAQLANQGQYMTAQQATDASNQYNADLGIRSGQLGLQGAGLLNDLEKSRYDITTGGLKDLAAVGQDWQQLSQAGLDLQFEDFLNQRDYPRQNLEFLSGLLRGVPTSVNQSVSTTQNISPASSLLGSGLSAYALSQLMGSGTQTT